MPWCSAIPVLRSQSGRGMTSACESQLHGIHASQNQANTQSHTQKDSLKCSLRPLHDVPGAPARAFKTAARPPLPASLAVSMRISWHSSKVCPKTSAHHPRLTFGARLGCSRPPGAKKHLKGLRPRKRARLGPPRCDPRRWNRPLKGRHSQKGSSNAAGPMENANDTFLIGSERSRHQRQGL